MENQEQQNKIMGVLIAVFVLSTIVTTGTAIMFLTEKNKLVRQNEITNNIIRQSKKSDIKIPKNSDTKIDLVNTGESSISNQVETEQEIMDRLQLERDMIDKEEASYRAAAILEE